jgi:hypothetical protein
MRRSVSFGTHQVNTFQTRELVRVSCFIGAAV